MRRKAPSKCKQLTNDSERLNWLLNNRKPGPVCWYRDSRGEEWLIRTRKDIDRWSGSSMAEQALYKGQVAGSIPAPTTSNAKHPNDKLRDAAHDLLGPVVELLERADRELRRYLLDQPLFLSMREQAARLRAVMGKEKE